MRRALQAILTIFLSATIAAGTGLCRPGSLPQTGGPLSEDDLIKLLGMGASNSAISGLVGRFGVSFQPDPSTLARLRKAGAQESLLAAIRNAAPPPKPPPQEIPPPPAPQPEPSASPEAAWHLGLGQLRALERDYDGALREYSEAQRLRPTWGEVFFQRGLLLAEMDRYSEAAAEWKKYVTLAGPSVDRETINRKIAEWESQADKMERANRLTDHGKQELRDANTESAIESFQEAAKLNNSMSNLLNLARAYLLKGDYESLSKTAAEALSLDPQSAYALLYLGATELARGQLDEAIATVQRALFLDTDLPYGYALLASAAQLKEESRAGQADRARTPAPETGDGAAHNRLGWVLWNGGDFQGALQELRKAAQVEPKNAAWSVDLSYALNSRGDTAGALAAAHEALHLSLHSAAAHDAMGLALESRGMFDQATQEFQEASKLSFPGNAVFAYHLSRVSRKNKAPARGSVS